MRSLKKWFSGLLILVLLAGVTAIPAYAKTISQDGLIITLETDKEQYDRGESIASTVSVKNVGRAVITDISVQQTAPEGYKVSSGTVVDKNLKTLEKGESAQWALNFDALVEPIPETEETEETEETQPIPQEHPEKNRKKKIILVAAIVSAVLVLILVVVLILIFAGPWKKFFCLLLCGSMLAAMLPVLPLQAEALEQSEEKTAEVSTIVVAGGQEITLTASVSYLLTEEEKVTVSYETNGGSKIVPTKLTKGKTLSRPTAPTRSGYTFQDWYTDRALTKRFRFTDPVNESITLYAKWTRNSPGGGGNGGGGSHGGGGGSQTVTYVVTFESNGGSTVSAKTVKKGAAVPKPADPTRKGFEFVHWCSDKNLTRAYDFSRQVTGDMILYAKWQRTQEPTVPETTVPETTVPETTVPETTVPETTEPETTDPPSKADDYYNDTSESVEVLDAEDSETVLTEAQAVALLRELGFTENPVYFEYMEDGTHVPEEEASEASDQKHPIYHTLHYSGRQELWNIYLMNGSLMAYPVVYNMSLGSGPELMVSETNTIIGYDGETNRFFITVPKAEVMTVKVIERIDAAALDGLNLGGQS